MSHYLVLRDNYLLFKSDHIVLDRCCCGAPGAYGNAINPFARKIILNSNPDIVVSPQDIDPMYGQLAGFCNYAGESKENDHYWGFFYEKVGAVYKYPITFYWDGSSSVEHSDGLPAADPPTGLWNDLANPYKDTVLRLRQNRLNNDCPILLISNHNTVPKFYRNFYVYCYDPTGDTWELIDSHTPNFPGNDELILQSWDVVTDANYAFTYVTDKLNTYNYTLHLYNQNGLDSSLNAFVDNLLKNPTPAPTLKYFTEGLICLTLDPDVYFLVCAYYYSRPNPGRYERFGSAILKHTSVGWEIYDNSLDENETGWLPDPYSIFYDDANDSLVIYGGDDTTDRKITVWIDSFSDVYSSGYNRMIPAWGFSSAGAFKIGNYIVPGNYTGDSDTRFVFNIPSLTWLTLGSYERFNTLNRGRETF